MVKKSETSGIMIPEEIYPDDGSVRTMSPIESPLSLARKKMTAHMINERVAMIRAGMTPEEIIAFYNKKEKGGKKKGKKGAPQVLIPEAIPELTDLRVTNKNVALPPPPPPSIPALGMSLIPPPPLADSSCSDSVQKRKIQTFQDMMQQRPSHFQAFKANPQLLQPRDETFSIHKTPKPSHFAAFEEASLRSGASGEKDVIRTKSLKSMQRNGGGAAPPHYLAFGEEDGDLSKELSAFWAKQKRTNSFKREPNDAQVRPVRRTKPVAVPASGENTERLKHDGRSATKPQDQHRRCRSSDGIPRDTESKEVRRRCRSNDGNPRDGDQDVRRRSRSNDGSQQDASNAPFLGRGVSADDRRQPMKRVEGKPLPERKTSRKPERVNSVSPTREYEPMRRAHTQPPEPERHATSNGDGARKSGYTVKMKPSARSPLRGGQSSRPPAARGDLGNSQDSQNSQRNGKLPPPPRAGHQLPPPPPPRHGMGGAVAVISGLPTRPMTGSNDFDNFVGNDHFENGSFKSLSTMNTKSTMGTRRTAASSAKPYRLRDPNLVQVSSHDDDESVSASVADAFGTVRRNENFVNKQAQIAVGRT